MPFCFGSMGELEVIPPCAGIGILCYVALGKKRNDMKRSKNGCFLEAVKV